MELPLARLIGKVNQSVAIVDLDVQHPQNLKPQNAGDLGARVPAEVGQIEGQDILAVLGEAAKSECCFVGPVNLGHRSTNSTRSEEHTSELQSLRHLVCRLL